ncbi:MAG: hypothetical protein DHS20C17_31690 [Cyclobacteriaceae bacterium]|nr:MAG: hypothetical protein DHS20C17_31690 [Cyclobacteriaceae bacterium]
MISNNNPIPAIRNDPLKNRLNLLATMLNLSKCNPVKFDGVRNKWFKVFENKGNNIHIIEQ